jgi:nonribosomal peptide synthetase DhbF
VLDDVVGAFTNVVVLRTDTSGAPSFGGFATTTWPRSTTPTRPTTSSPRPWGRSRLPQVLIVHHQAARLDPLGGHTLALEAVPTGSVAHDLVLSFYEGAPREPVECVLEYRRARIDAATAQALAEGLVAVLRDAADAAGQG